MTAGDVVPNVAATAVTELISAFPKNDGGVDGPAVEIALRTFGERILALDPLGRELARRGASHALEELGIPNADRLVGAALRQKRADVESSGTPDAPGSALAFPDPDPWPAPVDGSALLADLAAFICRFVQLPAGADLLLATFSLYSFGADRFTTAPYLVVHSPAPQCGKTRVLEVLELLVRRPWRTITPSTPVLFRVLEAHHPTLLLDEAEVCNGRTPAASDIRAILQSGYKRGSAVPRCVGELLEVRMFDPFGPKAFALIGELSPALFDRCIPIPMERRQRAATGERFRPSHLAEEASALRRRGQRWAIDHAERAGRLDVPPLDALSERQEEVWGPLLAVALAAGGDEWYRCLRGAAESLSGGKPTESVGISLLSDIRVIIAAAGADRIRSADLAGGLNELEGRPWADWNHGRGISPNQIARQLRDFGVAPGTIRLGDVTAKGYRSEQFARVWSQYVPAVTSSHTSDDADNLVFPIRNGVTDPAPQIVADSSHCDVVTGPDAEDDARVALRGGA